MVNLQRIKEIAEYKGVSIRDLAERVGLGENRIHVMCRTNSTKIDTLEKIAAALNVSVKVFFDDDVTFQEEYHAHGEKSISAKHINVVDQRDETSVREDKDGKIRLLEALIAEKDERITELKERIEELKAK
ncbi:MAG: helix-turn-helix domain-containing protein [Muribaculaceae bacterium]|nr:helix-turn-helix domain-containing protein [Muribaculaceae bacterium]